MMEEDARNKVNQPSLSPADMMNMEGGHKMPVLALLLSGHKHSPVEVVDYSSAAPRLPRANQKMYTQGPDPAMVVAMTCHMPCPVTAAYGLAVDIGH